MNLQMRARLKAVRLDRNAFQISSIYLLIGGLWILFSDRFAEAISNDIQTLTTISTYKGWGYVLVTGLILYWLIHFNNSLLQKENEELQAAEKKYRLLVEQIPVAAYEAEIGGHSLYISPQVESLIGFSSSEWLADRDLWLKQIYPDDKQRVLDENARAVSGNHRYSLEYRIQGKDGRMIWIRDDGYVVKSSSDIFPIVHGIWQDITERKRSEELLSESEKKFRTLIEQSVDGVVLIDEQGHVIEWNPAEEKITGIPRANALGAPVWDIQYQILIPEHRAELNPEHLKKLFLDSFQAGDGEQLGKPLDIEILSVNGERKFIQQTSFRIKTEKGNRVGSIFRDITKRKRAEKALSQSEQHFHSLFDHMLEGYAYCKISYENGKPSDFIYLEVNDAFEKLTGITKAVGRKVSEIIPGIRESNPELLEIYGKAARTGESTKFETYVDELKIWFSISVYSVEKDCFVAVFDNITERKHTEEFITESNRQLKALVTSLDDIVFEVDAQGTYLNVWTADESLLSEPKAELLGKQIEDTLQKETAVSIMEATQRVLKTNHVEEMEYPLILPSGLHWFLARISPITSPNGNSQTVSMLVRDITERKATQEVMSLRLAELELVHQSGLELSRVLEPEEIAQKLLLKWKSI